MEFFARFSAPRDKKELAQTTFQAPPQPSILKSTATTQIPIFPIESPQVSAEAPASNQPHAAAAQSKNAEGLETVEGGGGEEGDALVEGMQGLDVNPGVSVGVSHLEIVEGETHVVDVEKATPCVDVSRRETIEGEIPVVDVEGETHMGNWEGETPVESLEGETPVAEKDDEGRALLILRKRFLRRWSRKSQIATMKKKNGIRR